MIVPVKERGRGAKRAVAITAATFVGMLVMACGFGLPQAPSCTSCPSPLQELKLGPASNLTINDVEWSPDSSMIATASDDGTARLWDPRTGKQLKQFSQLGPMRAARWSPDGSRLAVSGDDGPVRVYNVSTGTLLVGFDAYSGANLFADWSPDGTKLGTIDDNGNAGIWDAATGTLLSSITRLGDYMNTLAWSPDSTRLAVAGFYVEIWDISTGRRLRLPPEGRDSISWSPDGNRLLVTGELYNANTGALLSTLQGVTPAPNGRTALAWSGDEPEPLSIDPNSGTVTDSLTGKPAKVIPGQAGWSPDGSLLAAVEWADHTVAIWPASTTQARSPGVGTS
jgi:WD40 repeat protein